MAKFISPADFQQNDRLELPPSEKIKSGVVKIDDVVRLFQRRLALERLLSLAGLRLYPISVEHDYAERLPSEEAQCGSGCASGFDGLCLVCQVPHSQLGYIAKECIGLISTRSEEASAEKDEIFQAVVESFRLT